MLGSVAISIPSTRTGEETALGFLLMMLEGQADFGSYRFLGLSLLPARMAQSLKPKVSGLYEEIWRPAYENGEIEFSEFGGIAFDCGTPETYALANEIAAKEASWPYKDDPKGG